MKSVVTVIHPEPSEAEIQQAAYYLWLERGRPSGRDVETWFAAKALLAHGRPGLPPATHPIPPRRRTLRTSFSAQPN